MRQVSLRFIESVQLDLGKLAVERSDLNIKQLGGTRTVLAAWVASSDAMATSNAEGPATYAAPQPVFSTVFRGYACGMSMAIMTCLVSSRLSSIRQRRAPTSAPPPCEREEGPVHSYATACQREQSLMALAVPGADIPAEEEAVQCVRPEAAT
ncbi:hypothetical protein BHS06_02850 [Myxococcus xanthus]|nr:hypothetical protein BHS06_02850 [Myxococcus xanthus]